MKKLLLALAVLSAAPAISYADSLGDAASLQGYDAEYSSFVAPRRGAKPVRRGRISRGEGCTPEGAYIQWACGGYPGGSGWVNVGGNCWHRDTGRRCY